MSRRALRKVDPGLDLSRHLKTLDQLPRPWDAAAVFGRGAPLEVAVLILSSPLAIIPSAFSYYLGMYRIGVFQAFEWQYGDQTPADLKKVLESCRARKEAAEQAASTSSGPTSCCCSPH